MRNARTTVFGAMAVMGTLAVVAGCAESARESAGVASPAADVDTVRGTTTRQGDMNLNGVGEGKLVMLAEDAADGVARKIVYRGTVDLVTEDLDGVTDRVAALMKDYGGYIAGSERSGQQGDRPKARWTLRIPSARYDEFMSAASTLGEVRRLETASDEVTEEYYDLETRIRNKTAQEKRLLEILETREGELEDVLAVERELGRVREEVERMEGRLRRLDDLTAMSTVTVIVEEIHDYVPPVEPTFATQVSRTFDSSLEAMSAFGVSLALVVVALAPWAVLFFVPGVVFLLVFRRLTRV